jgi:excisionase family DNA binding protein
MNGEMMSYDEASEFLGILKNTLYCMVSRQQIPHFRLGPRFVRFRRCELEEWLDARAVKSR